MIARRSTYFTAVTRPLRTSARAELAKLDDAADDVVGDVFLAIVSGRAGTYDAARGSAITWLRGVVRHTAVAYVVARNAEVPAGTTEYIDDAGADADVVALEREGDDGQKGRAR